MMKVPGFHQIYLDGRGHPADPNPAWYGHSIGRWDGDTLVVDRVAFDPRVWLDIEAHPHSDQLHIVERYHRPDLGPSRNRNHGRRPRRPGETLDPEADSRPGA